MVTYSNGQSPTLSATEVQDLLRRGLITHRWPDRPELAMYCLSVQTSGSES